jgi:octaprenyl-diphosphate synthase
MDYSSDAETMGKNVGDDLAEGKPTLPLIYIMQHGTAEQAELVSNAITDGNLENLAAIQTAIAQTKALDYVLNQAYDYADCAKAALNELNASAYKDALLGLTDFVVQRTF